VIRQIHPELQSCLQTDLYPAASRRIATQILRLQRVTLAWMTIECGVAIYSALRAHSPALLAFGSDSVVELLSAAVVLSQFAPGWSVDTRRAAWLSGFLLFLLAVVLSVTSAVALAGHIKPDTSWSGVAVTAAALVIMPVLTDAKRRAAQASRNVALAADAVQSAACAYLAGITLIGLAVNALVHIRWIDPVAALVSIPIICVEGWRALRGRACHCC
jgi:multisubunit Na+/H+ antiporter MnhB subunit